MTTSMNERTHFFIKVYLSHFILERVDVGCVWEVSWRRLLHIDPISSDHSSTSLSSWLWLLNRGSQRTQSPLSVASSHFGILSPTDSNWPKPSVPWLYYCLTSTCFRCSSAYLHRCISWLTARSRVNMFHEEFTLKLCKSLWRSVDTMIEKNMSILSKFTVLWLSSYFVVYLFW